MSTASDWTNAGLLLGRLAILPMFVASIWDKLIAPPAELDRIRSLGLPFPKLFERLAGLFEATCVMAIACGIGTRVAAAALALFTIFVTLAFMRFWRLPPSETTTLTRTLFFNNLSVAGGLVLLMTLGAGHWTLA